MGGSGPSMDFKQSGLQKFLEQWARPFWENMSSGNMPDMWEVPDISQMMPGEGWWEGLDSDIKAGIREPYEDASKQMLEVMGAKGQTGSSASPYSGSSATATGSFWADASKGMANQGWGMVSPALQQGWQAQLGQNQAQYAQDMMPYGMLPGATQMAMPYPVVNPGTPGAGGSIGTLAGMGIGGLMGGPMGMLYGGGMGGMFGNMMNPLFG